MLVFLDSKLESKAANHKFVKFSSINCHFIFQFKLPYSYLLYESIAFTFFLKSAEVKVMT